MEWIEVEINQFFDELGSIITIWNSDQILSNTILLAKIVKPQLTKYSDGKYRADRNELLGFFDAIERFVKTNLPISLEYFESLVESYKKRILPYPHYSGIKISVPTNFALISENDLELPVE